MSGDLFDRHTVIAVAGHADDIVTELTGVRPGHTDILPAHPSRASQLRCHLFVQQTLLTGISAGSICWHAGGTTDSFGPALQPISNGLGFLPYGNGVHYDSEEQRRPLLHSLVANRVLPASYATDDGAGLLYRGTTFVEAVAEKSSAGAYFVQALGDGAAETALDVRRLP
ncbi:hypothetical protein EXE63_15195 [Mycolicibacterium frederiksbergense]|uniref:Uncharacterized protein n=1 Tax=Mycolicibacterium frederiksbergense TaxID=117567 RepID=A0A6H0SD87_9MYCO|nr:hypothetical protein EXE63_15195 [Mycolicibacterium frederiksbergense]